jgi:8-hydroxy-5-deazaflavin:NADPH oxidoreductase
MRIAVIGTGHVGGTLGLRWTDAGHEVVYGARTPRAEGPGGAEVMITDDALIEGDVVVLAVPGSAVPEAVDAQGSRLAGKVVVDATNHMGGSEYNAYAAIKAAAPDARYARAFSTLGWENFAEPPHDADLFFASDLDARATTEELISAVGFTPVYVGDAEARVIVDGLLPLWFAVVTQQGGNRKLAFRVVR